jgi:hypothetical protein
VIVLMLRLGLRARCGLTLLVAAKVEASWPHEVVTSARVVRHLTMVERGVLRKHQTHVEVWIDRRARRGPDPVVADMLTATAPRVGLAESWQIWTGTSSAPA